MLPSHKSPPGRGKKRADGTGTANGHGKTPPGVLRRRRAQVVRKAKTNSPKVWVELTVENPEGNNSFIGQVAHPIERSIFDRQPDDFVRLERVRWREDLNSFEFRIVKQEDQKEEYEPHMFIKKRKILYVCPIRRGSEVWEDAGELPGNARDQKPAI